MEEDYIHCIHEFISVNSLIQSPAPLVLGSKAKEGSDDCIEQEEIVATHSI